MSVQKTYHHLQEVSEKAKNSDGSIKTWQEFKADTSAIYDKYNKQWLRAEYQMVQASAQMTAKWERFSKFGNDYDLLYKTAGDEKVRADHARLNGMCLPFDDPAWDTCFPPNGWGCRCDVIQVIPGSHPHSDSQEMIDAMEEMTPDKQQIWRYNPGKQQRLTPPKYPYYGKNGYDHCSTHKLAGKLKPNEECEILQNLIKIQDLKETEKSLLDWAKKEQGLHEAPTTQTGKILMSKKVADRFLHHAKTKEEKAILVHIIEHNEKLTFIREDKLGEKKDMNNPKDIKNIERKKKRGVVSYTVYSFENEQGKWKIGFEKTNLRGNLHESPYYIFPMSNRKKKRTK